MIAKFLCYLSFISVNLDLHLSFEIVSHLVRFWICFLVISLLASRFVNFSVV